MILSTWFNIVGDSSKSDLWTKDHAIYPREKPLGYVDTMLVDTALNP
jgi:hypothetical protein